MLLLLLILFNYYSQYFDIEACQNININTHENVYIYYLNFSDRRPK